MQKEKETDTHRLAQRQRQIDKGKNTLEYEAYSKCEDPEKPRIRIPNIFEKRSKRSWEGVYGEWRRALHDWYDENHVFIPDQSICSECGKAASYRGEPTHVGERVFFCDERCQKDYYSVFMQELPGRFSPDQSHVLRD